MPSIPSTTFPGFKVSAVSAIPVANSTNTVEQPEFSFEAWSEADPDLFIDGSTGSTKPIGLRVPSAPTATLNLNLEITGLCVYPIEWPRGKQTCQLKGTLNSDPKGSTVILSETWEVVLPDSNPKTPISLPLGGTAPALRTLTTTAPFDKDICPVPFRIAGDFEWECVNTKDNTVQPIKLEKFARLEFNWLLGPAVSGDNTVAGSFLRSGANLNGVYPINLLRLFLPHPTEFSTVPNFAKVHLQWWINNCLRRIPASRIIYDTIVGKSGFGVGCCGGSFKFEEFYKAAFPADPTAPPTLINSFDLAALAQLVCCLSVDEDGDELWNSKWVCKSPFGPQKQGMPFGINDKTVPAITWPQGVNNPFFSGIDGASPFETDSKKVKSANARAWVEVTSLSNATTVIDWSFAVPRSDGQLPQFEDASVDRATFAQRHIDDSTVKPILSNYLEGNALSRGECFRNDEFGSKQSGFKQGIARVGLYNLRGLNTPRPGEQLAPHIPIPPRLRFYIDKLIVSGKNPVTQRWRYNDASLKAMNIAPVVVAASTTLKYVNPLPKNLFHTALRVVSGAVSASYNFSGFAIKPSETGTLALTINVFDDFFNAYEAMAFALTTYERNINMDQPDNADVIVQRPTGPTGGVFIGNYSLQTPRSLIWIRGNLFVELTIQSLSKPSASASLELVAAAQRLDNYLGRHTVARSQIRRPHLQFIDTNAPPKATINGSTSFKVQLDTDDEALAQTMSVNFTHPFLLVHGNFDITKWTHTFWVLRRSGVDEKEERSTKVTIAGAHIDTFHPGEVEFEVIVAGLLKKPKPNNG
ncbi:hypothetical protein N0V90_012680 [Kalmusia sp. IMI 367209]|nr:hypothetical protein N0V90_012680 [Kalmusia sp. IMI 367209]